MPTLENTMTLVSNDDTQMTDYLGQSIHHLSVVSSKTQANLMRLCGNTYSHLLFHLPVRGVNRGLVDILNLEQDTEIVTFEAYIGKHSVPRSPQAPYRVSVHTMGQQGMIDVQLIFFRANGEYVKNLLPTDSSRIISGKLELFDNKPQIVHPDYVVTLDKKNELPTIQPIYNLTAGVTQRLIAKAITAVTSDLPNSPEWLRSDLIAKYQWSSFNESLVKIHTPEKTDDCLPESPYRQRLAYDAILAHQLTLAISRAKRHKNPAVAINHRHELANAIIKNLPFTLTGDQKKVTKEIFDDLQKPYQMTRLVQGDVGSGKTIVALLSASMMIQDKQQVAIMVPTEILAKQHYESLKPLCRTVGIRMGILTGKDKATEVRHTLDKLKNGELDFIVGTHALIQERVIFKNLALAIIDEQHRFGVSQRLALVNKGNPNAHLLLMTATPIPRSLAMAHYGDCDLSLIQEKPPLRKPVTTRVMPTSKLDDVTHSLARVIANKGRAYWVCPLVEESEKIDLMAAEERFLLLKTVYPNQVGLVHGKMKPATKEAVISDFMSGTISILVSTTVIEVGVNVPEATVMIIEAAERFGLSQLHQLRGRVGRGEKQSSCLLLYKTLNPVAIERLSILRETDDGFLLAEKDLQLRGAGDLLGTKQTGLLDLPAFDFAVHEFLIKIARDDATYILQTDPHFTSSRGKNLRILLKIMGYDNVWCGA